MREFKKYLRDISQYELETDCIAIKNKLMEHNNKISGEGFIANYYVDNDKISIKKFNTDEILVYSFQNIMTFKNDEVKNKYFINKKINMNNFDNIEYKSNNYVIPLFNEKFEKINEQRIFYNFNDKKFVKIFDKDKTTKDLFYNFNNIKDCDNLIFCEGVADGLSFYQFLSEHFSVYKTSVVCAMSDNNMLNVIQKILEINKEIKVIYYLIDKDYNNLALNTFLKIKNIINKDIIIMPIFSSSNQLNENNDYIIKDFNDIYTKDIEQLNYIKNNIENLKNNKLFITHNNLTYLKDYIDDNGIHIKNEIIKTIIKCLNIYRNKADFIPVDYHNFLRDLSDLIDFYDFDYNDIVAKIQQYKK